MSLLSNKWVLFGVGVVLGGTLLSNRVSALPLLNKIPKI